MFNDVTLKRLTLNNKLRVIDLIDEKYYGLFENRNILQVPTTFLTTVVMKSFSNRYFTNDRTT